MSTATSASTASARPSACSTTSSAHPPTTSPRSDPLLSPTAVTGSPTAGGDHPHRFSPAEAGGFEPPAPFGASAFKADAIGRSATLPRASVGVSGVGAQLGLDACEDVADDLALVVVEQVDEVGADALEVVG